MLRLKKISRSQEIHVSLRDKERLLSRPFLLALGIALALHLTAILLFHIRPFKIWYSEQILPPVIVEAEISELLDPSLITADLEGEKRTIFPFLTPRLSAPDLPDFPSLVVAKMETVNEKKSRSNPFSQLEKGRQMDYLTSNELLTYSPLQIKISGPLAEKPLATNIQSLDDPSSFNPRKTLSTVQKYHASYEVQVENKTGLIFWFATHDQAFHKKHQDAAEKMLRKIRFQPDSLGFTTSGEVEIIFADEQKDGHD